MNMLDHWMRYENVWFCVLNDKSMILGMVIKHRLLILDLVRNVSKAYFHKFENKWLIDEKYYE